MYNLIVKLMLAAALAHLGLTHLRSSECYGHSCVQILEKTSRDVLKIQWKPIILFSSGSEKVSITRELKS